MDSHHMDIIRRMASALLRQPSPSRSCLATSRRFATLDSWPVATSHDRLWQARAGYDRRQATTLRPCSGNDVLTWNDTNTMTHWWCTVCSAKRWCILRGGNDVREIWIFLMYHVLHDVCNTMQLWQNLPGETGLPVLHPGHYAASQWKGRQSRQFPQISTNPCDHLTLMQNCAKLCIIISVRSSSPSPISHSWWTSVASTSLSCVVLRLNISSEQGCCY